MIRLASLADIPRLVEMGMRFIAESEYREFISGSPASLDAMMRRLIGTNDAVIFVDGEPIHAMIGMHVYTHPMSGERVGAEAFWWVEPEHRGGSCGLDLLTRGEAWVKSRGAKRIQMIAPNKAVGRLYRSRGYRKFEEQYQRDIMQ